MAKKKKTLTQKKEQDGGHHHHLAEVVWSSRPSLKILSGPLPSDDDDEK